MKSSPGWGAGLANRQLADELFVSEKTVKTHVSSILMKLGLSDRTQAALFAVRVGSGGSQGRVRGPASRKLDPRKLGRKTEEGPPQG